MLFPIGDDDRHLDRPAYVTLLFIALNLLVFFVFQGMGGNEAFSYGYSVIPQEITTGQDLVGATTLDTPEGAISIPQEPGPTPIYLTILTAMFMHGGFAHLFGNLLYLWIFGDNVEHRFGALPFALLYLVSGLVATFAQIWLDPDSLIPNLGASGAISGVLGAYLVLFPRNKVRALLFYVVVNVPAILAIGLWIAFQFVNGWGAIMATEETVGGVAYGAHIGGFAAGVVLAFVLRGLIKERPTTRVQGTQPLSYKQPWR